MANEVNTRIMQLAHSISHVVGTGVIDHDYVRDHRWDVANHLLDVTLYTVARNDNCDDRASCVGAKHSLSSSFSTQRVFGFEKIAAGMH